MPTTSPNDARLDFRLRSEVKAKIEEAAATSGQSVSDFAVSTLLRAAEEILERQRMIRLSDRDFHQFLTLIDSETEPNEALQQAAARYKQRRV